MAAVPEVGRADTEVSSRTTHHLYEQYGRQVYAFCLNRLRSREEAEDAVQTTFLNAFRALQKGTQTRFEQAWLYQIAKNVCLERSQSSGRRLQVESPSDLHVLQEVASAHAPEDPEQLLGVEAALAGMPANQRKAILLREWQGLSYREIGEELGISQSSVEMLIFRARRSLARALEEPQVTERKKARGGRVLNLGSFVTGLKTLFTGGAAVKMAAVAVTAGTVIAAGAKPVVHSILSSDAHGRPKAVTVQHAAAPPASVFDVTPGALLRPVASHAAPARRPVQAAVPAAAAAKAAHPAHVLSAPFKPVATSTPPPTTTAAATPPPPIVDTQPTAQASGPVVTPTSAPGPAAPPASQPATPPTTTPTPTNGNGGTTTGSGGAKGPKSGDGTGSGSPAPPPQTNPQTPQNPQQPGTPTDQPPTQGTGNGDPKGNGHGQGRRGHGDGNHNNDPSKNQNQNQGTDSGQSPNVGSGQGSNTTTTTTGQTSTTPTATTPSSTTPTSTTPTSTTPSSTTPASTTPLPSAAPPSPPPPPPGNGNGNGGGDGNGHGHDGGHGHGYGH